MADDLLPEGMFHIGEVTPMAYEMPITRIIEDNTIADVEDMATLGYRVNAPVYTIQGIDEWGNDRVEAIQPGATIKADYFQQVREDALAFTGQSCEHCGVEPEAEDVFIPVGIGRADKSLGMKWYCRPCFFKSITE